MTVLVVGAGAIGQLVAGRLALAGHPVNLLARSNAQLLRSNGIHITTNGQVLTAHPPIVTAEQLPVEPVELAIVAVKGYDTPGVASLLAQLQPRRVLCLQNGVGNEEVLAQHVGAARLVAGTITTPVEMIEPTHIKVARERGVGLAAMEPDQQPPTALAEVVSIVRSFVPQVRVYANWRAIKWSKLLLNMLGNGLPALLDWEPARVYADPRLVHIEQAAFLEAVFVMRALGLQPANLPGNPVRPLVAFMRRLPLPVLQPVLQRLLVAGRGGKLPSLLLDLRRHSPQNEGDLLYGAVARAAERTGLGAPINRCLARLLADVSRGARAWGELRDQPERLLGLLLA